MVHTYMKREGRAGKCQLMKEGELIKKSWEKKHKGNYGKKTEGGSKKGDHKRKQQETWKELRKNITWEQEKRE